MAFSKTQLLLVLSKVCTYHMNRLLSYDGQILDNPSHVLLTSFAQLNDPSPICIREIWAKQSLQTCCAGAQISFLAAAAVLVIAFIAVIALCSCFLVGLGLVLGFLFLGL